MGAELHLDPKEHVKDLEAIEQSEEEQAHKNQDSNEEDLVFELAQ